MNCPGGLLIYKTRQHRYRDLPLRMAELGQVHRHEMSGVLHGLFRVRKFTQDDAHIYCLPSRWKTRSPRWCASCTRSTPLRLQRCPHRALDPAGQVHRHRRDVGQRGGRPGQRARSRGHRLPAQPGRRRLLRPQDRLSHRGRHGPHLAVRHHPGRLRHARAPRHQLHRGRQRGAPPGDDPPRRAGHYRAVHRHPDRALRRRAAGLAGAGAGAGVAGERPPRRLRRGGGRGAARRRPAGRGTTAPRAWASASATASSRRCPTCWSSAAPATCAGASTKDRCAHASPRHPARRLPARTPRWRDRARRRPGDRAAPRQGRRRGLGRLRARRLEPRASRRRPGRHRHSRLAGRRPHPAPQRLARARPGGAAPVAGHRVRHRADHRERLLLRLPLRRARLRRRLRPHRRGDGQDRRREPAGRPRRAAARRGAQALPEQGPALQGRAHRGPARRADHQHLHPGRVRRPVPRAAPAQHRAPRQGHLQADQRGRRLLARRRAQRPAHPHLRHRLRQEGGARRLPRGPRDGPPARPPPHRPRPRPLQLSRRRPRASRSSTPTACACGTP